MNEMFKKLVAKKKASSSASPMELKAKGGVLSDLMGMLDDADASKIGNLKKVSVASDSKSGLEHGLAQASKMVEKGPLEAAEELVPDEGANDEDMGDFEEEHEEESSEEEDESPEAILAKIEHLKSKLKNKSNE